MCITFAKSDATEHLSPELVAVDAGLKCIIVREGHYI